MAVTPIFRVSVNRLDNLRLAKQKKQLKKMATNLAKLKVLLNMCQTMELRAQFMIQVKVLFSTLSSKEAKEAIFTSQLRALEGR